MTLTCLLCNCEITSPYYELVRIFDHKQPVCKTCLDTVREGIQ